MSMPTLGLTPTVWFLSGVDANAYSRADSNVLISIEDWCRCLHWGWLQRFDFHQGLMLMPTLGLTPTVWFPSDIDDDAYAGVDSNGLIFIRDWCRYLRWGWLRQFNFHRRLMTMPALVLTPTIRFPSRIDVDVYAGIDANGLIFNYEKGRAFLIVTLLD